MNDFVYHYTTYLHSSTTHKANCVKREKTRSIVTVVNLFSDKNGFLSKILYAISITGVMWGARLRGTEGYKIMYFNYYFFILYAYFILV